MDPPIWANYLYYQPRLKSILFNASYLSGNFGGVAVTILVSSDLAAQLFPDISQYRDMDDTSVGILMNRCVHYILSKNNPTLDSFLGNRATLPVFLRHWMFFYGVIDGKWKLQCPWTDDRLRFHCVEVDEKRVPIYHPENVLVKEVVYSHEWSNFRVEVEGEEFNCYTTEIPHLELRHIQSVVYQDCRRAISDGNNCMPKLRGVVGYRKTEECRLVVGLLYEPIRGIPLSELSVPDSLRSELRLQVVKGYISANSQHRREGGPGCWRGEGPEHILVTEDEKLFFKTPDHRSVVVERDRLERGRKEVMSFLSDRPGPSLRRSRRITGRAWTTTRTRQHECGKDHRINFRDNFRNLPAELRLKIYEYLFILPERVMWVWDKFYVFTSLEKYKRYREVREWSDQDLMEANDEWKYFFLERNHFYVDVTRLHDFLDPLPDASVIKQITISVHAGLLDGGAQPWKQGIHELVTDYPELQTVHLHIYGEHRSVDTEEWLGEHLVLCELKQRCWESISKIYYDNPGHSPDSSDESITEAMRRFLEKPELAVSIRT